MKYLITGGCHYDEECGNYQEQCGTCPVLNSNKLQDLSHKVWLRKQATFDKMTNLNIIGLSRWLADCAKQSSLFKGIPVSHLPNPIDTSTFAPFNKQQARALLNLPQDKNLVLFGAMGAISDPRKGFKKLAEALTQVDVDNTELVVFGSSQPKTSQGFKQKIHYLGHLYDDVSLVTLYSAVDVMIAPSLQENLSNAIMESLACGTPVVAFDIGGNGDMIEHKKTGYLAKAFNTTDLKDGIEWILNSSNTEEIRNNSRKKVLDDFDSIFVVKKYIKLYQNIIEPRE